MLLLVPADPLRPRRPDEHFAAEARAAREAGVVVAVVDHDVLARGGDVDRAVAGVPADEDAVYRGWMLRAEHYAGFVGALARRGAVARTSAEQYRRAHELPGWWADLAEVTPEAVWTSGPDRAGFDVARRELGAGPAVLRDYTKSVKHHWHEAAFIPELADGDAAWAVARRFLELRDDEFTGGFVLRRFEEFTAAEVRTWWVGGECVLVGAHPDTPHDVVGTPSVEAVAPVVAKSGLPFVTVDLVLRADGVWRVVELGDGQVSDRPVTLAPEALVAALFAR
ncbi:ATP-grasp domain-containing protein [Umezawaea endophytica]|uniref:ATP-grasp domain-containing protein n=1 Tax=Umezawaea endophytica TaxID=1654476 RepID=A0A9X2VUN6_9PSEU|nr:ATP-grasp domain-containing protein [Umezawaea endophytica]MCS7481958.1 ATP-grasp domain-containing protein [Umezawaea endophytica]